MAVLEHPLKGYLESLGKEGERYARIKGLSFSLELIGILRKISLVCFGIFMLGMLLTASVFTLLMYRFSMGRETWDGFSVTLLGLGVLTFGLMVWGLREKTWMRFLAVEKKIEDLTGKTKLD